MPHPQCTDDEARVVSYWLGGRGDGDKQVWLNDQPVPLEGLFWGTVEFKFE